MSRKFTAADVAKLEARGMVPPGTVPEKEKRHKYAAERTEVDGERLDSKKEAAQYRKLLVLQQAGVISNLKRQVPYELNEGGTFSYKYIADFVYKIVETGEEVVQDAKGYRTAEYKKKKRLMKQVHNITITEV
jgi:hypothetical protein